MPTSPRIRAGLNSAVGGLLSAIAGTALAASPAFWQAPSPDYLTLLHLAVVGGIIGLGQGMAADPPLTIRQTIGRALQSTGIALSAGITLHLVPDASPIVIIAAGALLATVGTDALKDLWSRFIHRPA